jgi:predicted MFS family arabinose efflux permease
MASRSRHGLSKTLLIGDSILIAIAQIFIYFFNQYNFAAIFIGFIGFFYLSFLNMSNSILQLNTPNNYRGRIMSVYALITSGSAPIGNSFAGYVMQRSGANMGYFMCGLFTLVLVIILLLFWKINAKNKIAE